MWLYSPRFIALIQELHTLVHEVLTIELGMKVRGHRFYDRSGTSYPIHIVIFNDRPLWGYFDPNFYELGFHERSIDLPLDARRNLIRHELAHYMLYIQRVVDSAPHGKAFQDFCQAHGWGKEVLAASQEMPEAISNHSEVLRKVQKLMALSSSSNSHEAEAAMLKARELLLKNQLSERSYHTDEPLVLDRVLYQARKDAKMQCIARILGTFFVSVVYSHHQQGVCLDVFGAPTHVEIATYVANFLHGHLEMLWEKARCTTTFSGLRAKNSFFYGLATGYCEKVQALKRQSSAVERQAVLVIDKQLEEAKGHIYRSLQNTTSRQYRDKAAMDAGHTAGKKLQINPGVAGSASSNKAISYHS